MPQVLIAGAGPVGLTMAAALRRLGVDLRIVDKAPSPSTTSKALVLWPRTLELLDIDGCVTAFLAAGNKAEHARIDADGRQVIRVAFDAVPSPYCFALMLPQSETERLLAATLETRGTTVQRDTELVAFASDDRGVVATLRSPGGRQEEVRADYLIGCDGAHSTVRHGLGMDFEGETEPSDWLLADVRLAGEPLGDDLVVCWRPDGLLALFAIDEDRFRVVANDPGSGADRPAEPTLDEIQGVLDSRGPGGLKAHDPIWLSRFRINERKVKDYGAGRVFLAGDAAHIHSPAGGQGMNTGMQDAFNLAWKLALVLQGRAAPSLLETYSPERSAIGDLILKNATVLTHIGTVHNRLLQELRNVVAGIAGHLPPVRRRMADQMAETDLHYGDGPLVRPGASGHPAAGRRAHDIALAQAPGGEERLHELLRSGRFVVLSTGAEAIGIPPDLAGVAASARAEGGELYAADRHYLIRPDAYVSLVARGDQPEAILAMLREFAA